MHHKSVYADDWTIYDLFHFGESSVVLINNAKGSQVHEVPSNLVPRGATNIHRHAPAHRRNYADESNP